MKVVPLRLADFVDGADVRMVQCGGVAGFAQEPAVRRLTDRPASSSDLERHLTMERRVVREKHRTHAPATERPLELIATQLDPRLESVGVHDVG